MTSSCLYITFLRFGIENEAVICYYIYIILYTNKSYIADEKERYLKTYYLTAKKFTNFHEKVSASILRKRAFYAIIT